MIDRLFHTVAGYLPETVTPQIFTGLLIALVLLVSATLAGGLWWRHHQRHRFIYLFGILWDKKHHPFCATCRTPLGNWSSHSGWKFERQQGRTVRLPTTYYAFDCPVCTKPVRLIDHDGYEVTLEDALAQLQAPAGEDRLQKHGDMI